MAPPPTGPDRGYAPGMSQSQPPPARRSPLPGLRRALRTLFRNSFGSDALTAYSAEYAWLSNQMAHAMMGFFLASLAASWVLSHDWPPAMVWLPLLLPPLKELTDYALDAGLRGRIAALNGGGDGRPFTLNNAELLRDAVTDVFFWWFGMALGIAFFGFATTPWGAIGVGAAAGAVITLLLVFRTWLPQKRMFDASRMPFNFLRLVKYPAPHTLLTADGLRQVQTFQKFVPSAGPGTPGRHYVVIGGDPIARSELAVSLGCEFISHWKGVYFISAVKLLERPDRLDRVCRMGAGQRAAVCCLIVDDVNVALPIPRENKDERKAQRAGLERYRSPGAEAAVPEAEQAQAEQEIRVLDLVDKVEELRDQFAHVTTIWVLTGQHPPPGTPGPPTRVQRWQEFLRRLLLPGSADGLTVIALRPPPSPSDLEPTQ